MNNVTLVGRLTKDVDLRKTQSGKSVASFTVAINRKFNKDETDFINCVAWEKTAEYLHNYTQKGMLISVEGNIQTRSYDDKDGKRVFVQEVLANRVQGLEYLEKQQSHDDRMPVMKEQEESELNITDDDLPF